MNSQFVIVRVIIGHAAFIMLDVNCVFNTAMACKVNVSENRMAVFAVAVVAVFDRGDAPEIIKMIIVISIFKILIAVAEQASRRIIRTNLGINHIGLTRNTGFRNHDRHMIQAHGPLVPNLAFAAVQKAAIVVIFVNFNRISVSGGGNHRTVSKRKPIVARASAVNGAVIERAALDSYAVCERNELTVFILITGSLAGPRIKCGNRNVVGACQVRCQARFLNRPEIFVGLM